MKRWQKAAGLCLLAIFAGVAAYVYVGSTVPAGQVPLTSLNTSNFAELRNGFNEAAGSVRIVTLLAPT